MPKTKKNLNKQNTDIRYIGTGQHYNDAVLVLKCRWNLTMDKCIPHYIKQCITVNMPLAKTACEL